MEAWGVRRWNTGGHCLIAGSIQTAEVETWKVESERPNPRLNTRNSSSKVVMRLESS